MHFTEGDYVLCLSCFLERLSVKKVKKKGQSVYEFIC